MIARKNHYTHARGKFRNSAHLSRSFVGIFVGISENYWKNVNNISKSGGRHLHHTTILSNILQDLDAVDIDLTIRIPKVAHS